MRASVGRSGEVGSQGAWAEQKMNKAAFAALLLPSVSPDVDQRSAGISSIGGGVVPPQGGLGARTGLGLQENQDRFHWICLARGAPPQDDVLRGPQ